MNPTALRLRGYRTFEELDLDLPAGCVGVLGLNGAGKSSIVNAIDLALFGPEGRSWAPYLTVGAEGTELTVELEFEHAGHSYRVRRGYSARGAGKSTIDLEEGDGGLSEHDGRWIASSDWRPLTLGSAKETQARLEQILGFTRRTLRASSLLLQGDGAAFTEADPRDRKRILADTLGLDRFERLLAAVRRDRRATEQEIARIDGRLEGTTKDALALEREQLEATIVGLQATIDSTTSDLAAAQLALDAAALAWQAAQTAAAERATAIARRDEAAATLSARVQLREDAAEATSLAAIAREEIDTLPTATQTENLERREQELTVRIEAHREAVRARDETIRLRELREAEKGAIEAQASATRDRVLGLDSKVSDLEAGQLDNCPTCQQALGEAARTATIGSLRAQAETLVHEAEALFEQASAVVLPEIPDEPPIAAPTVAQLTAVQKELRAAREAELHGRTLTERLAGYNRTIGAAADPEYLASIEAAETALRAATTTVDELPEPVDAATIEARVVQARNVLEGERVRLATAERQKAVEQERLAQLDARVAQLEQDLAARQTHLAEIDLLAILERAYGPDGIPALIVENAAIPQIEVEAGRILTALGGSTGGCRLELRTERALKGGGIGDTLDVVVVTEQGERAYETFSGGERTRLNLALRIALARLLATRRGADSRILAIDEPEFLDEDGTAALVDVLRELERDGVFDRVYLVSHVPALRDSFDLTLQVVKEDGRSRVEGQLEAVAA